jgi:serine/threonine-protein kinase
MDGAEDSAGKREPERCLDEQAVLDFAAGFVPANRLSAIERHLAGCDQCAELVVLTAMPRADPVPAPDTPAAAPIAAPTKADRLLQPAMALNQTYRIVRFIGRGGMGEVYEVTHSRLAGRYAAKVLSLDLAQNAQAFSRFRREAHIASGLSHPNIVQVIDFSELDDGRPFLVMEFLDGHDLAQILAESPLPLARTMRLVEQIVSALTALHAHRIVHRDLKPQNIFVLPGKDGDSEHVKLVDFGLAKRASASMAVTHERALLGTPQYMAPEQAVGKADGLGPEADQFALAALLYEMLGGKPAFEGEALSIVLYRIVHEMPEPLSRLAPGLPPRVYAALERGLAKAPEARFPSIKAFLHELQSEQPIEAAITDPEARRRRRRRRDQLLAGAAAATIALGGGALFHTWTQAPPTVSARADSPTRAAASVGPGPKTAATTKPTTASTTEPPAAPGSAPGDGRPAGPTTRDPDAPPRHAERSRGIAARPSRRSQPAARRSPVPAPDSVGTAAVEPTTPPPPATDRGPLIEKL